MAANTERLRDFAPQHMRLNRDLSVRDPNLDSLATGERQRLVVALERDIVELDAEQLPIWREPSDSRAVPGFEGITVGARIPYTNGGPGYSSSLDLPWAGLIPCPHCLFNPTLELGFECLLVIQA